MSNETIARKVKEAWQAIRLRFTCWHDGHDWEQVSFDVGRCLRCKVELKTTEMYTRDLIAFIRRFRRVG